MKGLLTGIGLSGVRVGILVLNSMSRFIVNPEDKLPEQNPKLPENEQYYSDDIAKNVPLLFLFLSAFVFLVPSLGVIFLGKMPSSDSSNFISNI